MPLWGYVLMVPALIFAVFAAASSWRSDTKELEHRRAKLERCLSHERQRRVRTMARRRGERGYQRRPR